MKQLIRGDLPISKDRSKPYKQSSIQFLYNFYILDKLKDLNYINILN